MPGKQSPRICWSLLCPANNSRHCTLPPRSGWLCACSDLLNGREGGAPVLCNILYMSFFHRLCSQDRDVYAQGIPVHHSTGRESSTLGGRVLAHCCDKNTRAKRRLPVLSPPLRVAAPGAHTYPAHTPGTTLHVQMTRRAFTSDLLREREICRSTLEQTGATGPVRG
jgi:hypothetical protein